MRERSGVSVLAGRIRTSKVGGASHGTVDGERINLSHEHTIEGVCHRRIYERYSGNHEMSGGYRLTNYRVAGTNFGPIKVFLYLPIRSVMVTDTCQ